jgi:hypothetical protein
VFGGRRARGGQEHRGRQTTSRSRRTPGAGRDGAGRRRRPRRPRGARAYVSHRTYHAVRAVRLGSRASMVYTQGPCPRRERARSTRRCWQTSRSRTGAAGPAVERRNLARWFFKITDYLYFAPKALGKLRVAQQSPRARSRNRAALRSGTASRSPGRERIANHGFRSFISQRVVALERPHRER